MFALMLLVYSTWACVEYWS